MEAVFNVLKGPFSSKLKRDFNTSHPELIDRVSSKNWKDTQIFLDGYYSCLSKVMESPINPEEVEGLMISESLKFIVKNIK